MIGLVGMLDRAAQKRGQLGIIIGRVSAQGAGGISPGERGEDGTTREGECAGEQRREEPLPVGNWSRKASRWTHR